MDPKEAMRSRDAMAIMMAERDEAMMVFRDAISAGQALAPFAGEEAAATVIQQAFAERDGRLADHVAVHRAMLQGHIAKPSPANIWHLYQRDLLDAMPDEFKAERDGEIERLREALRDMAELLLGQFIRNNRSKQLANARESIKTSGSKLP